VSILTELVFQAKRLLKIEERFAHPHVERETSLNGTDFSEREARSADHSKATWPIAHQRGLCPVKLKATRCGRDREAIQFVARHSVMRFTTYFAAHLPGSFTGVCFQGSAAIFLTSRANPAVRA
jgi:hypothetical protein